MYFMAKLYLLGHVMHGNEQATPKNSNAPKWTGFADDSNADDELLDKSTLLGERREENYNSSVKRSSNKQDNALNSENDQGKCE